MRKILDIQLAVQKNGLKARRGKSFFRRRQNENYCTMFSQGKSAEEIAKAMKLPVETVKNILGENKKEEKD